jgi:hypothetical protein
LRGYESHAAQMRQNYGGKTSDDRKTNEAEFCKRICEGGREKFEIKNTDDEQQLHAAEIHDGAGSETDNKVNTQRTGSMPAESGKGRITEKGNRQTCGQNCEVYSRVVGYYRPVTQWNKGKQEEFKERTEFKINGGVTDAESIQSEFNVGNQEGKLAQTPDGASQIPAPASSGAEAKQMEAGQTADGGSQK